MKFAKMSISLPPRTLANVDALGTKRSTTISLIVDRYVALIEEAETCLRGLFTAEELNAIIDAGQDYVFTNTAAIVLFPAHVQRKWGKTEPDGINASTVIDRLRQCQLLELTSLAHSVEANEHYSDDIPDGPEK